MKFNSNKSLWLFLACWSLVTTTFGQVQFKIELLADEQTYQVSLRSDATYTGPAALTSTGQVTLVAPTGTFAIDNLMSVHGTWDNNSIVQAPDENPDFDYFMVGLVSLGTGAITYTAGEETILFTFENLQSCTAGIEIMEADDPFWPPNSQNINAGNELFILGYGNGNAWSGNYDQGSAECPACEKPIEYTIALLPDGETYQVSLRSTTSYEGVQALTNSAQVTVVAPTGGFSVLDVESINGIWSNNTNVEAPDENPNFDYFIFGLINNGTGDIPYIAGEELPLFTFKNGGFCTGDVALIEANDLFYPPNNLSINAGNEIVIFGYGNQNAWCGNYGSPAPCLSVRVEARLWLQGAYVATDSMMQDSLRVQGRIPLAEPYTDLNPANADTPPFEHHRGGMETIPADLLLIDGEDAIVDWVFLELRSAEDSTEVVATRSALVQRDGDVVDVDGLRAVEFMGMEAGTYFLSVRHRNHLGIMTATALDMTSGITSIDFTDPLTSVFGTEARIVVDETAMLWGGNTNADGKLTFAGMENDLDVLFFEVLEHPANLDMAITYITSGYLQGDTDMDGTAIFQGPHNDIALIFLNVMQHPLNTSQMLNYMIMQQLP